MAKRVITGAADVPLAETTWLPAKIRFGRNASHLGFLLFAALSAAAAWQPLTTVLWRSLVSREEEHQHYSHIVLLPLICGYLVYVNRAVIFERVRPALSLGIAMALAGASTLWLSGTVFSTAHHEDRLSLAMVAVVVLWAAGFTLFYGVHALRRAAFPWLMLLFMAPLPPAWLSAVIRFLQRGSADVSELLFAALGMPVFREGFVFALPGLTIHVAEECSGIRSSLALLISGLTMAYLFLHATWARTTFVLMIVPLAIVKNAVRIVVLSWLAVHVDPSFITGSAVHRTGGIPVFFTSLVVLGALVWLLRWRERKGALV